MLPLKRSADHKIVLGNGDRILAGGLYEGVAALFIEPTDNPHTPGERTQGPEDTHPHGPELVSEGTTVVTFGCRDSLVCMIETLQELLDGKFGRALP